VKIVVIVLVIAAVCLVLGKVLRCSATFLGVVMPFFHSISVCKEVTSGTNHKRIASTVLSCIKRDQTGPFSLRIEVSVIRDKIKVMSIESIEGLPPEKIVKKCVVDLLSRLKPQLAVPKDDYYQSHSIEISKRVNGDFIVVANPVCSRDPPLSRVAAFKTERGYLKPTRVTRHAVGSPPPDDDDNDVYQQAFRRCEEAAKHTPDEEKETLLIGFSLMETENGWSCRPCLSEKVASDQLACFCKVLVQHRSEIVPSPSTAEAPDGATRTAPLDGPTRAAPVRSTRVLSRQRKWLVRHRAKYYSFDMLARSAVEAPSLAQCFER
jgi:hypothetical protein